MRCCSGRVNAEVMGKVTVLACLSTGGGTAVTERE